MRLGMALGVLDEQIGDRRVSTETVPVRQAVGRVLAVEQRSKVDLPPFDKSAVDGYAIRADVPCEAYRLAGVVAAGQPGTGPLRPGTAVKVMTGAPVPAGADRVVMVERATQQGGLVRFENPDPADNICRRAEDIAVGQSLLAPGTRLEVLHVAILIACGISEVDVARRIRVAIIATGDELVDSPDQLSAGKIINSNGPLLSALAQRWGLAVTNENWAPDDKPELTVALREALAEADIVLLSGGVSAGDYDFVPEVITDCGLKVHFSRVAVKPGLATTFATGDNRLLFGFPGNPVAVYVTFHLFGLRAAMRLSGGVFEPRSFKIRLARDITRRSSLRTEYCPCRVTPDGFAENVSYHGSAHLSALMKADGFVVIPQGVESIPTGAEVSLVTF